MGTMFEQAMTNLTSPVVLFFGLGLLIALYKAKIEFPSAISDFITIYLLVAIGFKGGVAIAQTGLHSIFITMLGAILLGIIIPIYSYYTLLHLGRLKSDDAAAIAGHYGSISIVTFMAATVFLTNLQVYYEGFMYGIPALMEVPGVIIALMLATLVKKKSTKITNNDIPLVQVAKQVILSKSVVLLLGSMVVGYISGPKGMETVEVFYKGIFMGMLSLFMLEMGMVAATKISDLKKTGAFLVLFGIITPIVNAALGVTIGVLVGLSLGGVTLLGVLAASCSYIVAPAAMRVSLPKANPALYLGASLGVTLPFNLVIGIPLYYQMANYFIMITR